MGVNSQAFRVECHAPTSPAPCTASGGRLQGPSSQPPASTGLQARRRYLGLTQGRTLPGWPFAGIAKGEEKEREKRFLGCPSPGTNVQTPITGVVTTSVLCCHMKGISSSSRHTLLPPLGPKPTKHAYSGILTGKRPPATTNLLHEKEGKTVEWF